MLSNFSSVRWLLTCSWSCNTHQTMSSEKLPLGHFHFECIWIYFTHALQFKYAVGRHPTEEYLRGNSIGSDGPDRTGPDRQTDRHTLNLSIGFRLKTPTDHPALATTNNTTNLCTVDGIGHSNHFSESMDGVKNCYWYPWLTILSKRIPEKAKR